MTDSPTATIYSHVRATQDSPSADPRGGDDVAFFSGFDFFSLPDLLLRAPLADDTITTRTAHYERSTMSGTGYISHLGGRGGGALARRGLKFTGLPQKVLSWPSGLTENPYQNSQG